MSPAAFDALCTLTRTRATPTREAARDVLVRSMAATGAARAHGIEPQTVRNAVAALRRALALAETAAGHPAKNQKVFKPTGFVQKE